jgi:hypothetical protein
MSSQAWERARDVEKSSCMEKSSCEFCITMVIRCLSESSGVSNDCVMWEVIRY